MLSHNLLNVRNSEIKPQVLLVSMPFGPLFQPSIGLGLLKAGLTSHQISAKVLYFTLQFAELIGTSLYMQIANGFPAINAMVGEWVFNGTLFDSDRLDIEGYIEDVLRERAPAHKRKFIDLVSSSELPLEKFIQDVLDIRSKVEAFLEICVQQVADFNPPIVALTSIFQQHVAALSLAKRIKAQLPETFIIMGGANCEGIMGVEAIRQFPFLDATVSGEGDIVFPKLVQRILQKKSVSDLPGVHTRNNIEGKADDFHALNAPSVSQMDSLPYPNYDDFFEQLELSRPHLKQYFQPQLLFETSRGCWWGAKNHCTFCGLNGATLNYRSKSAERAFNELVYLTEKHPNCQIGVVDNILDMKYFKDFVPKLAANQLNVELMYEVKSNLRKEQVHLLRDAGITTIQPGIESFSSRVLEIMRKGVKSLQNIQLLKWCKELGVRPISNILWGFPGEPPEEYQRMAALIPLLTHLEPPSNAAPIRLDRFSPNFDHPQQFGFVDVEPYPSYRYIYPLAPEAVANLAYYFAFGYSQPQDVESYTKPLVKQLLAWKEAYKTSSLFSVDKGAYLLIWDLRPVADQPLKILTGLQRIIYLSCDSIQTTHQLKQLVAKHSEGVESMTEISELVQPLIECGLMIEESGSHLSLAISLGEYSPNQEVLKRFQEIVKTLGQVSDGQASIPLHLEMSQNLLIQDLDQNAKLTPNRYKLSADHFSLNERGELVIDIDAIALIPFNLVKLQLSGLRPLAPRKAH